MSFLSCSHGCLTPSQERLKIITTAAQFAFTADVPTFPWPATGYDPDLEAVEALAAMLRCCRARSITFTAPAVSYKASARCILVCSIDSYRPAAP